MTIRAPPVSNPTSKYYIYLSYSVFVTRLSRENWFGKKFTKLLLQQIIGAVIRKKENLFWPTRPQPNRWSLFSHRVSVRPYVRHKNNAIVVDRKTKDTMCENNDHLFWLGPGGSLWSLSTCFCSFHALISSRFYSHTMSIISRELNDSQ